jgi:type III restriction enzyme
MALTLKNYQQQALAAIETFFEAARGARDLPALEAAFTYARKTALGEAAPRLPYRPLSTQMAAVPQVCIRIPTGGGKTLLAAHAIERAARMYVGTQTPLALWLVPSNTIRAQTLDALKMPGHPYREALLQYFPVDRLKVIDITECEQLRAQDFTSSAIVVVGTIQTLRVDNTASRDVYAYKEAFEPHFAHIRDAAFLEPIEQKDLDAQPYLGPGDIGKVKRSFANLLAWYRPIVIVDEAHNNTSNLSVEVLNRIRPACVIEWSATPTREKNVLYHVSASELKDANMIKLPIVLSPHPNWQEAVRDAVLTRERLAKEALSESDYVRPIVLFQAENINNEVNKDVLKNHLIEALHIDASRIAVATGNQRELDGINLFDRTCPIDFVITVEALKEGWDCSFAYVFCPAQKINSAKDMEQLLGRVLRLPYATPRKSAALSRAYAHVCSPNTALVANQLADRLVSMGFEEMEVAQFVQPQFEDLFSPAPRMPVLTQSIIDLPPKVLEALQQSMPDSVTTETTAEGTQTVVSGLLPASAIEAAIGAAKAKEKESVTAQLTRHQTRAQVAASPAQRGETFAEIPQLCVPLQGELTLYDPDVLGELSDFSLVGAPADLPGFSIAAEEKPYLIDVEKGRLRIEMDRATYTLDLNLATEGIRREDLIRELDRRIYNNRRERDFLQVDMIAWLGRVVDARVAAGMTITEMARHLNLLVDAIVKQIKVLLLTGRLAAFNASLFDGPSKACLSNHFNFKFDPARYPARWLFSGRYNFAKHYYPVPGELDPDIRAEETACAIEIDGMSEVKSWVRNLERQAEAAFWLPTSTDKFYPDFVAELNDGRVLVVEYKGGDRMSNDDSKEKRTIGQVWGAASNNRCVFVMVTDASTAGKPVGAQLRAAL